MELQPPSMDLSGEVRASAKEAAQKFRRKLEILGDITSEASSAFFDDNESRELVLVGEAFKMRERRSKSFVRLPTAIGALTVRLSSK